MNNQKEVRVTYNLSEVNLANRTAVLRVRQEHLSKGHKLTVSISGQLVHAIKKSMKDIKARKFVNIDFTSTLMSPSFDENPLKLIKFSRPEGDPTFHVQLVTDKGHYFKEYSNAMNQRVKKIQFKHWKTSEFMRFWEVQLKA